MMNWLYYLLEANLYLAVFYGCYRLLLHKETFYATNRYFLIFSTLIAFTLPVLQIGYLHQLFDAGIDENTTRVLLDVNMNDQGSIVLNTIVYTLYWLVAIGFILKFGRELYQVFSLSKQSQRYQKDNITYISINQHNPAFSFFNLLFIQPDIQGKETILKHELVHIRQLHSLDIVFFEIIQVLNWFNPITYLLKKDIKLLHEYIADEQTTLTEIEKYDYALFLIKNSFGMEANPLSNHIFNQSILKQRINMLNKEKSTGRARLKLLFALPIAAVMLGTSTMAFTKDYSLVDLYPVKVANNIGTKLQDPVKKSTQKIYKKNSTIPAPKNPPVPPLPPPPPPQEPVKKDVIKFPPPIVKSDKKKNIKFPPPIVVPDKKNNVKFPPPIVVPDKKINKSKKAASSDPTINP